MWLNELHSFQRLIMQKRTRMRRTDIRLKNVLKLLVKLERRNRENWRRNRLGKLRERSWRRCADVWRSDALWVLMWLLCCVCAAGRNGRTRGEEENAGAQGARETERGGERATPGAETGISAQMPYDTSHSKREMITPARAPHRRRICREPKRSRRGERRRSIRDLRSVLWSRSRESQRSSRSRRCVSVHVLSPLLFNSNLFPVFTFLYISVSEPSARVHRLCQGNRFCQL